MSLDQSQFEDFVRAHNPLMVTKADSPARWHGSKDAIKKYEENPYAHPWTVGAWEGWKAATAASEKRIKELEQLLAQEQLNVLSRAYDDSKKWIEKTFDSNRQTGRTTKQMLAAPQNAVYVWCNDWMKYPHKLAMSIGRGDLRVVGKRWLQSHSWRGLQFSGLVVDHDTRLTQQELDAIHEICIRSSLAYPALLFHQLP